MRARASCRKVKQILPSVRLPPSFELVMEAKEGEGENQHQARKAKALAESGLWLAVYTEEVGK